MRPVTAVSAGDRLGYVFDQGFDYLVGVGAYAVSPWGAGRTVAAVTRDDACRL